MNNPIGTKSSYVLIISSLIIGLMLVMLPLPAWANPYRPDWLALILIYWSIHLPGKVGIGIAFCAGLLLDVTLGTLLGQHALGLVLVIYIVLRLHQRLRLYPPLQQSILIMLLLMLKQLEVLWIDGMVHRAPNNLFLYFMSSVISALLWPWVSILLRDMRRKFSVL